MSRRDIIDSVSEWAIEHDYFWIADVLARIDWIARGVRCFFIGHDVKYGDKETYESDYCARCFRDDDMFDIHEDNGPNTVPTAYAILREKAIDTYWLIRDRLF